MTAAWLLAISLPAATALLLPIGRLQPLALALAPWTALPAFALALLAEPGELVSVPILMLGAQLGIDVTSRYFLFFTSLLWMLAGLYARGYMADRPHAARFFFFYLVAMSGNLGLVAAHDVVTFYLFFTLMTLSAYGLVAHEGTPPAYRAARVYIVMAVLGEALLLAGFLLSVAATGSIDLRVMPSAVAASPDRNLILALLLAGFGIKAGAIPLHVWLPLAHPVAPTPASAVLSGAMIKAGLLGWLRFLPLGETEMVGWGTLCMIFGLAAAFYGVAVGLAQDDPKTNLAYSSVSQMGYMTAAMGVGLAVPEAASVALVAVAVYALHHALAKGALFLGVGVASAVADRPWQRWLLVAGLVFSALALAGAPLTSGSVAKAFLKDATLLAPAQWPLWLDLLLPFAALGTTLLMARFLLLVLRRPNVEQHHYGAALWAGWVALLAGVVFAAWLLPAYYVLEVAGPALIEPAHLWASAWPVIAGTLLVWVVWRFTHGRRPPISLPLPPGDVLVPAEWSMVQARDWMVHAVVPAFERRGEALTTSIERLLRAARRLDVDRVESHLERWSAAGILLLALLAGLFAMLVLQ